MEEKQQKAESVQALNRILDLGGLFLSALNFEERKQLLASRRAYVPSSALDAQDGATDHKEQSNSKESAA